MVLSRLAAAQPPVMPRVTPGGPATPTTPTTPATPLGPTEATLQVQVANRDSRGQFQMLPDVQVTVMRGRQILAAQRTDANGYTAFRLPPGEYYLGAAKEGYQSQRESITLAAGGSLQRIMLNAAGTPMLQVAPGLIPVIPQAVEPPTYWLTVRAATPVQQAASRPVRGAVVTVSPTQEGGDRGQAQTDETGQCRFRLHAGEYRIQVDAAGYHRAMSTTRLTADTVLPVTLQPSVDIR